MRSPPAAMRSPSSSCVPRAIPPRRRPRKHPIMVKPCSRLSATAQKLRETVDDGARRGAAKGGIHTVFPIARDQKKPECLVSFAA